MEKGRCEGCVAKNQEIAELEEHLASMREQMTKFRNLIGTLENTFFSRSELKKEPVSESSKEEGVKAA